MVVIIIRIHYCLPICGGAALYSQSYHWDHQIAFACYQGAFQATWILVPSKNSLPWPWHLSTQRYPCTPWLEDWCFGQQITNLCHCGNIWTIANMSEDKGVPGRVGYSQSHKQRFWTAFQDRASAPKKFLWRLTSVIVPSNQGEAGILARSSTRSLIASRRHWILCTVFKSSCESTTLVRIIRMMS